MTCHNKEKKQKTELMSQPLIKFVSQNHSDDSVDSHREYKVHRHTHI